MSTFLGLEVLKLQISFLPLTPWGTEFLHRDRLSDTPGSPLPGNPRCTPSSHSWGEGMRKMPAALSPHIQPTGSFLFLGKSNILWDDRPCMHPEECRSSSELSHRKLMARGSALQMLCPWLSSWRASCPPKGMRGHLWGCGIKWPYFQPFSASCPSGCGLLGAA